MATIGENLRAIRKRKKISLLSLALKSGAGVSTITAIERGDRDPKTETIGALAHALGYATCALDEKLLDVTGLPQRTPKTPQWY